MLKNKKINEKLILDNQLGLGLLLDEVEFVKVRELNAR